jgi:endonuclease-3 related protein
LVFDIENVLLTLSEMAKKDKKDGRTVLIEIYKTLYNAFGPQYWWPGDTPFEVAIGAILTQNTNWANVEKAIENLKNENVLAAGALRKLHTRKLASLIRPSGYFNVKARRLKSFLSYLTNHYNGSLAGMKKRDTQLVRKELLEVNGIGPETADSILLYALDKPVFVIDAYTKRVLLRHGIVSEEATYHELQGLFHKDLPADTQLFNEYHALFVRVGKEYCRPDPECGGCPLKDI